MYRRRGPDLEVLLVHPGGPFWAAKDDGAWSIPKGEFAADEAPAIAARREFIEEIGRRPRRCPRPACGGRAVAREDRVPVRRSRATLDPATIRSNAFTIEWPPRSGQMQSFPEVDRAAWFRLDEARAKIVAGQRAILDELGARFATASPPAAYRMR